MFGKKKQQEALEEEAASAEEAPPEADQGGEEPQSPALAMPQGAAAPLPPVSEPAPETEKKKGWLTRLRDGLSKSSNKLSEGVTAIFTKKKLDDETLDELTDLLITADLGVPAATRITTALAKDKFDKAVTDEEVRSALATEVAATLAPLEKPLAVDGAKKPHILLMVGVNGAGKTTTIGKLAKKFADEGKSVMLAAGDTFRAAAIEQLQVWGTRTGAPVIARAVGADAAGLAFDAVKEAKEKGVDILMIDTAGRLQNRRELMDELAKIVRVIKKLDETAPHDVILTLDATVGQNALSQAQAFTEIAGVTGIVMTKLDGTARGGVLVALADKFKLPIHFIGVGEGVEDLQNFNADAFSKALAASPPEPPQN
ncbi:signal recognition particle-docking protein FtsY [Hyphococcus sp.]|uniref:signal recognition particle-docking protein FtsY n=1 Tax=Hyphococcus sp. TaxID=2038636 RepID=UPI003D0D43BE